MTSQITYRMPVKNVSENYTQAPVPLISSPLSHLSAIRNRAPELLKSTEVREPSDTVNLMSNGSKTEAVPPLSFYQMTLTDLLDKNTHYDKPPTSKQFRVILFNEALTSALFQFSPSVQRDIKRGLLSGASPSYKFLASQTVSLAQAEKALHTLKEIGQIGDGEFNTLHSSLKKHAITLSKLGNDYHMELMKKKGQGLDRDLSGDSQEAFLTVQSHKRGKFTQLYKQASKMDTEIKMLLDGYPDVMSNVSKQMNESVCQFVNHYFQPETEVTPAHWRDCHQYIKENAADKIDALFHNDARSRPGHLFNAGGAEHLYDCYTEIFDHFKTTEEMQRGEDAPPTHARVQQDEPDAPADPQHAKPQDFGNSINNNFSPVFNPINSPNFFNNINDRLLDRMDDNHRLLAEILDRLVPKVTGDQDTQSDPIRHRTRGTDPMPGNPNRTQSSSSDTTDAASLSFFSSEEIEETPITKPVAWTKLAESLRQVTVHEESIASQKPSQSTVDYMPQKAELGTRNTAQQPESANDMAEKVPLRPTQTRAPLSFDVNQGYREQQYGQGFVASRRAAYEETFLSGQRANSTVENKAIPITSGMETVQLMPTQTREPRLSEVNQGYREQQYGQGFVTGRQAAYEEAFLSDKPEGIRTATGDASLESNSVRQSNAIQSQRKTRRFEPMLGERENVKLKPTQTRDPLSFEVNTNYRDRAYYDEHDQVIPGFVADRKKGFEVEGFALEEDNTVILDENEVHFIPERPILSATKIQQSPLEDDVIFYEADEVVPVAARSPKYAEKVQNNQDFLTHLKSEKGIKVI